MIRTVFRSDGFARTATLPGWAFGLCAVGFALLAMFVLLLGAAFALVLAPVVVGVALFARWRLRRFLRDLAQRSGDARRGGSGDPRVIDADYRVLPED